MCASNQVRNDPEYKANVAKYGGPTHANFMAWHQKQQQSKPGGATAGTSQPTQPAASADQGSFNKKTGSKSSSKKANTRALMTKANTANTTLLGG